MTTIMVPAGILVLSMVVSLGWVLKLMLRRLGASSIKTFGELSGFKRGLLVACISIAILGMGALGWGFYEPYRPVVERVVIPSSKISDNIRVVQVSDLHCDPTERAEEEVISLVKELHPDLIVFTGDGVNSDEGIPLFKKTMRALAQIASLYGVRGNWEAWWFRHVDTFANTGIVELDGEPVMVRVRGQELRLVGCAVEQEKKLEDGLRSLPKDSLNIAVHHYPSAYRMADGKADLLLSGDTHGGQVALPFIGPLVRIHRWNDDFHPQGLHETPKGLRYYVNRGIGMEGGNVPRVRFNRPPEVTLLELVPAGSR